MDRRKMKPYRQSIIRELVERESITSQEQLRSRLRERGIDATQATLSRDIRELGLVKRTADGAYRSVGTVANGNAGDAESVLAGRTADRLRHQEVIGHMIVMRTDPGQAQGLAVRPARTLRFPTSRARSPATTPSWSSAGRPRAPSGWRNGSPGFKSRRERHEQ